VIIVAEAGHAFPHSVASYQARDLLRRVQRGDGLVDDTSGNFRIPGATYFDEMTGLLQELGFSVSRPGDSIYGN